MCALNDHKHIENRKLYEQDFHGNKVYSSLKCSSLLVKEGSFNLEKIWCKITLSKQSSRFDRTEGNQDKKKSGNIVKSFVLVFDQVHTVKFERGYFSCSYNSHSRYRIPYSHIYNVVSTFESY